MVGQWDRVLCAPDIAPEVRHSLEMLNGTDLRTDFGRTSTLRAVATSAEPVSFFAEVLKCSVVLMMRTAQHCTCKP
jgi:hypothetical protein